ncbi:sensory neuron membrane protein 2 [Tetranychus urticae]|uniref:Scavenger receptor class B member 1 n=1 Tax=Tetranychus urticae TaxID=32264 RepID=T1K0J7_TETUR|nr:sensory neuron membrane protein 2 [Tetranychus urticae]
MGKLTGLPLFAIIFGAIGFTGFFLLPPITRKIINQKIVLSNGSALFTFWKDMPLPVFHKFYFYNITNPSEVENDGAKPNLVELGPFTYRLKTHNTPIINPNGTISFYRNRTWIFDREASVMDENVTVYTINAPLVITLTWIEKVSFTMRKLIEEFLASVDHGFIIEKSIKELTFLGYPDMLMELGSIVAPKATAGYNGKFAYFHHRNGTSDYLYTIYSGVNDINKINLLTRINGQDKLGIWADEPGENEACNRFNDSTLGEMFPSLRNNPTQTIKLFTPDLSRTLSFTYQKSHFLFKRLETWKYLFADHNFASPSIYPPNKCYNSLLTSYSFDGSNETLPSGVFDASTPNYGFPIFLSLPHFLGADPYYLTKVNGLSPNETDHLAWFEIEPTSGSTAAAAIRLQLNIGITRSQAFKRSHKMPNIVFPAFWMEISFSLSSDFVGLLILINTLLSLVPTLFLAIGVGLAGLFLFIASLQLIIPKRRIRINGCLNILTCHLYQIVKDDEQKILDPEEMNDDRN